MKFSEIFKPMVQKAYSTGWISGAKGPHPNRLSQEVENAFLKLVV